MGRWADRARSDPVCGTAERFGLEYEWDETSPVDVACRYPAQRGLDFELWLSAQGDEFVCCGKNWYASIFPADDEYKWGLIVGLVEGLITGEARVVLHRAIGWSRPYWTQAQLRFEGRWQNISTGAGCAIPPIVRRTILRNGYATTVGHFRLAIGSVITLLVLSSIIYLTLK